jgi:hypothetical protein
VLQPEAIVLYEAAVAGKLGEVKAAVDAGAQVEWANPDEYGNRAIHAASWKGHKDVVATALTSAPREPRKATTSLWPFQEAL